MAMNLIEIENLVKEAIPDAVIDIQDLAGDNNHYSATIISSLFKGKSKIEQHKLVYNALKGKMGNELHALAIKTKEKD
jgi:stress-induced morphogen